MNTTETIRKNYLAALKDPTYGPEELRNTLESAAASTADLWQSYEDEDPTTTIDARRTNWTPNYFSGHLFLAERNFSKERVDHLLEVRQFLRERGDKGFAPDTLPRQSQFSASKTSGAYNPPDILSKFASDGDVENARIALRLQFNDNRLDSSDLHEASNWVQSQLSDLYEPYIEKEFARGFDLQESNWTPEYYDEQLVYLKTNFSKQRFQHLIDVRASLRARKEKGFAPITWSGTPGPVIRQDARHRATASGGSDLERNPALRAVLLLGGALAAVVVLVLSLIK